ncbi:MAG: TIM barrel protein [Pseudomonadota bacterium]
MKFSANLGFLWTDRSLPDAIRAAGEAGFDAVECHFPYDEDPAAVRTALGETGLPMLGLNTVRGDLYAGDFGLSALPGREVEAKAAIDQALSYAAQIGCRNVHVMAGRAEGDAARETYRSNLIYAAGKAADQDLGVLIEPINTRDVAGYHLSMVEDGAALINDLGFSNLRLMLDCYHTQIMQGDLLRRIEVHLGLIGHLQIAAVPDRGEPNQGEVAYSWLIPAVNALGYTGFWGAEYKPRASTNDGLGWLRAYRD